MVMEVRTVSWDRQLLKAFCRNKLHSIRRVWIIAIFGVDYH